MELNPEHPVTKAAHQHWQKICALLMFKQGIRQIDITDADIRSLNALTEMPVVVLHDMKEKMRLILFPNEREAMTYAASVEKKN